MSTPTTLDRFTLADLEEVRILLRGGSVIDWRRLNYDTESRRMAFLRAHEFDHKDPGDLERAAHIQHQAVTYLRTNFDFPVPKPVAQASLPEMLELAAGKGHRQICACTILKVMHILHHLEARELLFTLPVSDKEVFHLVEQKAYGVIGEMMAGGHPIVEFIGGTKNKDSLVTKLLSKEENLAAKVYDKLRFRIVLRSKDDIFPALSSLLTELFPFNYVIPGESTNTLFHFKRYCEENENLRGHLEHLQISADLEEEETRIDNTFSAKSYRVVNFVVDLPIKLPQTMLQGAPPATWALGKVIFVQVEFQVIDRETVRANEEGEASHEAYKARQRLAVKRRLKVGMNFPPRSDET